MNDLSKDVARHVAIDESAAGQRVDNFLLRVLKGVPKSHVYRILRSGEVRVNRRRVRPDARLAAGDDLRIPPVRMAAAEAVPRRARPVVPPILYEDDALIAIDKPAGLAVHGGSGVAFGAIEQLRAARPDATFLELAHRLDRDTSGVLLLAKKRSALTNLHAQLRGGEMRKIYLVLVRGRWTSDTRHVQLPLSKYVTPAGERRVSVSDAGLPSQTLFRRALSLRSYTLLEAELLTGRTHQIRVHFQYLGCPVAGDRIYGRKKSTIMLERHFLHATSLTIRLPGEKTPRTFEARLPEELQQVLNDLRTKEAL